MLCQVARQCHARSGEFRNQQRHRYCRALQAATAGFVLDALRD
jgi:hypothetical protein